MIQCEVAVIESWTIHDRWWTDDPLVKEFCEVIWGDRTLIFSKVKGDPVWRIERRQA